MATNPTTKPVVITADRLKEILAGITGLASEIEGVIAPLIGLPSSTDIEKLTVLFGNLAGLVISSAHEALGQDVTPESVMKLLPATTPLKPALGDLGVSP